jgi:hypothetical protein
MRWNHIDRQLPLLPAKPSEARSVIARQKSRERFLNRRRRARRARSMDGSSNYEAIACVRLPALCSWFLTPATRESERSFSRCARPAHRPPSSIRPAGDDADECTPIVHFALEIDRLATDLTVLDVAERARRQIHHGLERFATKGTQHGDKLGCAPCHCRAPRLKHGLETVQCIDGLRIGGFLRLLAHLGNLHHAKPVRCGLRPRGSSHKLRPSALPLLLILPPLPPQSP